MQVYINNFFVNEITYQGRKPLSENATSHPGYRNIL